MKGIRLAVVMIVVLGLGYPLAMTGISQLIFPHQANGSMVYNDQKQAIGSELIGQSFEGPQYFHGRISSIKYDGAASGTPNYAPSNEEMIKRTKEEADKWLAQNPGKSVGDVPLDLITNSGSGLDPHISPEAARFQIPAVAKATGLSNQQLEDLLKKHVEGRALGVFGEPRVNVFKLNLDLHKLIQAKA
ncbi:K+-transporting ATPase ATPase C chain [Croceifilum oryzae]|uniref:Potassium-transporting ATPase KdpC subunit n=1 Tax=Croceifilum oryzae TaxID=1553429 RepID=A0AAJ1TFY9_9BACL|nr:potassium-transporting ATPase subunit KdpC [Croceifilum oryzae]MDQ0418160.1 K+-transporting ATPase ATPase C chain [Croceifilum oryzae]